MGRLGIHSRFLVFFLSSLVGLGGGAKRFLSFFLCSNRFPMCSPWVFPIAPCFNPICFAQSPPLFTYIGGWKGEALHLSIESSNFWEASRFQLLDMGQSNSTKRKLDLWGVKVGPKMVLNSFGRRNFLQPTGRPKHTPKVPYIFQFGGGGGGGFRRGYFPVFPGSF